MNKFNCQVIGLRLKTTLKTMIDTYDETLLMISWISHAYDQKGFGIFCFGGGRVGAGGQTAGGSGVSIVISFPEKSHAMKAMP